MLKVFCSNPRRPSSFSRSPSGLTTVGPRRWFRNDKYEEMRKLSIENRTEFWDKAANDITWFKKYQKPFDETFPEGQRWFRGGMLNGCYNLVDRHVESGRGNQKAIIWDSPVTNTVASLTYAELQTEVKKLAKIYQNLGVKTGDRVVIYSPMILETAIAMLACLRIGAVHSVVFGGFSAEELAVRIEDAAPKLIVAGNCGIEKHKTIPYLPIVHHAIELTPEKSRPIATLNIRRRLPPAIANTQTPEPAPVVGRDFDYHLEMAKVKGPFPDCVPVESTHPSYILYTSGTTGKPKGVTRDTAGYLTALRWSLKNIYGIQPGDTFMAASDLGWVVGHSYILYGPLANGNTTIMFEGKPIGTPDAGIYWRMIQEHKIKAFFTAPTSFRAIKKEDPNGELLKNYDISSLKTLFLAGERADPDTIQWAEQLLKVPVVDHWWMTETGWAITGNFAGPIGLFPTKYGSGGHATAGYDLRVLDSEGHQVEKGVIGNLVIKAPLPPGVMTTLWNNHSRYEQYFEKFPGYFETGDAGYIDEHGYAFVLARTDDIINVAGHRLSTGHIEEVIASHPMVAECCVFGVQDEIKGEIPLGLVVLKNNHANANPVQLRKEIVELVREHLGPVYSFKHVGICEKLPKTRSGKILRATLRKIANGQEYKAPATIEDPSVLTTLTDLLHKMGFPHRSAFHDEEKHRSTIPEDDTK